MEVILSNAQKLFGKTMSGGYRRRKSPMPIDSEIDGGKKKMSKKMSKKKKSKRLQ